MIAALAAAALLPVVGLVTPLVAASAADSTGSAFTATKTITRTNTVPGQPTQTLDTRTVKVDVSETANLRNRQQITVSWSGAHPTGGIVGDQTSSFASNEEYPVVVMQCRGVDSTSVPVSQRISPQTCWTQTAQERFQSNNFAYPPFRVDAYGSAADRENVSGAPSPYPGGDCAAFDGLTQHWVPFISADGKTYPYGPQGCAGLPPEATGITDAALPNNTTYGVTDTDGTGAASFVMQSADTNASEGCSVTVKCSLVVIPIMGVSCDVSSVPADTQAAADALCTKTGAYQPGDRTANQNPNAEDQAVGGVLWWSASNWRNRISTPITFAPSASSCSVDDSTPIYLYGSELMTQAMVQWQPYFCTTKGLFDLAHVQTGEPAAKNLLQAGSIDAALESQPPDGGYARPVTSAPVAYTGFAITFKIDGLDGTPITSLKMTPRLLAKLLTESYPGNLDSYTALAKNPATIDVDPEFRALNPNVPKFSDTGSGYNEAGQMLVALSSQSDLMYALTSYINSDQAARDWLDGNPDPWGMVVNPNYKGIELPVQQWPLLDSYLAPPAFYQQCTDIAVPWMPLVASPVSTLAAATLDMQFAISPSQTGCSISNNAEKFVSKGREDTGKRFLLGVTSLADARRYDLPTASLATGAGSHTFVAPTDAAMRASASLLSFDKTTGTWPVPYTDLRTAKGNAAYPGAMLVSMDVPTEGMDRITAAKYATFMRFVAGAGQTPGDANGDLPSGYLPITTANNLGALAAYTKAKATVVQTQNGTLTTTTATGGTTTTSTPKTTTGGITGGTTGATTGSTDSTTGATTPTTPASSAATPAPTASTPSPAAVVLAASKTGGIGSGLGGMAIPLALLLSLLCAGGAAATIILGRRAAG